MVDGTEVEEGTETGAETAVVVVVVTGAEVVEGAVAGLSVVAVLVPSVPVPPF